MTDSTSKIIKLGDPSTYPPPPEEIINGVIYKQVVTCIWGPAESGKSHIAIDLACIVAQKYPVVYIAAEASHEIINRMIAWKTYYGKEINNNLYIWKEPLLLMSKEEASKFIITINPYKPALIVIDPLAQCFTGGNENETKDMVMVTNNISTIIRETYVGVLIVAHTGWRTEHERGSSVLRAYNRISFSVDKDKGSDDITVLKCVKRNSGLKIGNRFFNIIQAGDQDNQTVAVPATKDDIAKDEIVGKKRQVLEMLGSLPYNNGVSRTELIKRIQEECVVVSSTAYKYLNQLMELELVTTKGHSLVIITQDGIDKLETLKLMENSSPNSSLLINENLNWKLANSSPILQYSSPFSSNSPSTISPILHPSLFSKEEGENGKEKKENEKDKPMIELSLEEKKKVN